MDTDPRSLDNCVRAGVLIRYCSMYYLTRGSTKVKHKSARIHIQLEYVGISKSVLDKIKLLADKVIAQPKHRF